MLIPTTKLFTSYKNLTSLFGTIKFSYYSNGEERINFVYKVKETIYNTLQKNNIEIPFPQRDVYIRQMSAPEKTAKGNK